MPVFIYKAINKYGTVVKNRVDDVNKYALVQKLKRNDLTPIDIIQVKQVAKKKKMKRKNIKVDENVLRNIDLLSSSRATVVSKFTLKERLDMTLAASNSKVSTRDIIIFTESFYLLKKANFNNIHALNTIIASTENYMLKEILEDILAGV